MTQNILVQFDSDTSGISEGSQALDKLAAKEKELTSTFEKGTTQTNSALKTFTDNLNNAGKANLGAFGTKGIKEYQAAISQTLKDTVAGFNLSDQQARKFFKNLQDEAKKGLKLGGSKDDIAQFQASLNAATEALKELGNEEDHVGGKSQTLKAKLREMKAELATLDTGSSRFISLAQEAAELEDKIQDVNQQVKLLSSDTSSLDAGIQAVNGLAGAFAAAQGAVALFGDDNAEVQQTLLKVNAAMSIMQGLQQVGQLLDKNSALNIFLIKTLRLQQAAATTAVAVADGEAAVGAEALAVADTEAAVAQESLNVAMSANPAGVLILALGTLVGLIEIFIGDTAKAAKAQERLNDSFQEGIKTNNSFIDAIKSSREQNKVALEAQNASAGDLRKNDILGLEEQLKQTKKFEDSRYQVYVDADNRLRAFAARGKDLNADDKREKDALEGIVNSFSELQKKRFDIEAELSKAQIEDEHLNFQERLKNHTAFIEASVLQTREGSRQELVAQLSLIRAKEDEQLKSEAKLPGEIAQIRAQADRDAAKVKQQIRVFDLNQDKLYIDARLQKSKEGSQEELNARIDLLQKQAQIDIAQAQGNSAKILDIKAKEKRDEFELARTYSRKIRDEELSTRIAGVNSELSQLTIAGADATNEQLLLAKEHLLSLEADRERNAIKDSELAYDQKVIAFKAIDDKELANKRELEKAKRSAEINQDEAYFNAGTQLEADRLKRSIDSQGTSLNKKAQLLESYYNKEVELVKNASDADRLRLENKEITQKDFDTRELSRLDQLEELKTQKTVAQAELRKQKVEQIAEFLNISLSTLATLSSNSQSAKYEAELNEVQDLEDRKLITKEEAEKRNKKIRRDQAADEKKLALFEAELSMSLAIAKAIVSAPFPKNLLAIAFATFQGLAQIAAIASRPIPQLWKGTKKAKEGVYRTGELGQELMWHKDSGFQMLGKRGEETAFIPEGARVYNHIETMDIMRNFPSMASLPKDALINVSSGVDSKAIGKELREALSEMPSYSWNIDNDGISQSVRKGNHYTTYLNRKYSSRK